ncbi:MAG: helix-turn-helix transcriptional regulator [Clostridia bacterium]|nr:helix-turn-helix transcriptional regulator [Clostridia bacterium]
MNTVTYVKPKILDCGRFIATLQPTHDLWKYERVVKDYEIDYNIEGGRTMWVDGRKYEVTPDSVVCRLPGQRVMGIGNYNMYMMTLDFSNSAEASSDIDPRQDETHRMQSPFDAYYWDVLPTIFEPIHGGDILDLYRRLAYTFKQNAKSDTADKLLAALLHLLLSDAYTARTRSGGEPSQIDRVLAYMNDNYARKITLDELAELVHLNKSYLIRLFRKETGQTPIEHLNGIRLSQAKKLLSDSGCPVSDAAYQSGFDSASYFIARFKSEYGLTPEQYRQRRNGGKQ